MRRMDTIRARLKPSLAALSLPPMLFLMLSGYGFAANEGIKLKSERLAVIPEGYSIEEVQISAHGQQVAFSAAKGKSYYLFTGQQRSAAYDTVKMVAISPDGSRAAASVTRNGAERLLVDGVEGKPYEWVCNPVFSPDSRFIAHETRNDGAMFITVGGKEGPRGDSSVMQVVFSPDSRKLAYILEGKTKGKATFLISDTAAKIKNEKSYDAISSVAVSPDGSWFAFVAQKKGKKILVAGDFSDAAGRFWESAGYEAVTDIIFSPDSSRLAFVAGKGEHCFLVTANRSLQVLKESPLTDAVESLLFSTDGKAILVLTRSGRDLVWRLEPADPQTRRTWEKTAGSYEQVDSVVMSPDGSGFAYRGVRDGKVQLVVSSFTGAVKESPPYDSLSSVVYSPNGKLLSWLAVNSGKNFVVIGTHNLEQLKKGQLYDRLWPPKFSTDSLFVVYGALKGRELWWRAEPVK